MISFLKGYLTKILIIVIATLIAFSAFYVYKSNRLKKSNSDLVQEKQNLTKQLYLCKKNTQISIMNAENNQTAISSQSRIDELLRELRNKKNTINNINLDDGVLFFKSKN